MPYYELLVHLSNNGDCIKSRNDGIIHTVWGDKYIESKEGIEMINGEYHNKMRWHRV